MKPVHFYPLCSLPYSFSHPYEFELEHFTPPARQMECVEPRMYNSLEETPLVMVGHADQLPGLLQELASYSEIAVDVEVSSSLQ
jgi:exosome complex exonuclease RRP6